MLNSFSKAQLGLVHILCKAYLGVLLECVKEDQTLKLCLRLKIISDVPYFLSENIKSNQQFLYNV